jgi:hypothetical protein
LVDFIMSPLAAILLAGFVVLLLLRRQADGADRHRRRAIVLFVVLALIASREVSFSPNVLWRGFPKSKGSEPLPVSIPVEMGHEPGPGVSPTAAEANHTEARPGWPIVDRLRPKRSWLLAMAGGKGTAAKKGTPGVTAGSPSSAAAARAGKPPVAPSVPLTPNPSPARGEGSDEPASSRPAWVDAQPDRVGDVFQMAVSVGPYPTLVQCDTELTAAIRDAIQEYAENHLDHRARGVKVQLDNLESLPQGVIAETYAETVSTSFGAMRQLHARLTFDHRASQWVREQVRDALVGQRLWYAGGAATGVLAGLAVLWMGLRWRRNPAVGVC